MLNRNYVQTWKVKRLERKIFEEGNAIDSQEGGRLPWW